MSGETLQRVIAFTARQLSCKQSKLSADTTLQHDLGVDGLDGSDYIEAYAKEFEVDVGACRIDKHFGPDPDSLVPIAIVVVGIEMLIRFCCRRLHRRTDWLDSAILESTTDPRMPITLGDLVTAAETRRWPFSYEDQQARWSVR
jgi:acyl carrier protein